MLVIPRTGKFLLSKHALFVTTPFTFLKTEVSENSLVVPQLSDSRIPARYGMHLAGVIKCGVLVHAKHKKFLWRSIVED